MQALFKTNLRYLFKQIKYLFKRLKSSDLQSNFVKNNSWLFFSIHLMAGEPTAQTKR